MMENGILMALEQLRKKRQVFHSESDFQFALAWELKSLFNDSDIRLEYATSSDIRKHIDILVRIGSSEYPIELKYKTRTLSAVNNNELYHLKNHGAQDLGVYDFIKDICRIESFTTELKGFHEGYVLWLTNDSYYWRAPLHPNAGYFAFSVHSGAVKTGVMKWGDNMGIGSIKGRELELVLQNEYLINWNEYSGLGVKNGQFKYCLVTIPASAK